MSFLIIRANHKGFDDWAATTDKDFPSHGSDKNHVRAWISTKVPQHPPKRPHNHIRINIQLQQHPKKHPRTPAPIPARSNAALGTPLLRRIPTKQNAK